MKIRRILFAIAVLPLSMKAQYAPEAGMPGSTAMHADSSAFVAWATGCTIERGLQQIDDESLGFAYYGAESDGIGKADNMVVSLGDGGKAVLTFASNIVNGEGPDFAVFENAFHNAPHAFLELAFVEVSSDGEHFFRFPAVSAVPADSQMGSFELMDATLIHNFAGKYEAFYGTPFDLDDLTDDVLLDKNNVSHVRLIDVVGNIDPRYASYDSEGNAVNDPWPTPFYSSGFDLDAVGVIHDVAHHSAVVEHESVVDIYPNPTSGLLYVRAEAGAYCEVLDMMGQRVLSLTFGAENPVLNLESLASGVYLIRVINDGMMSVERIMKR